MGQSTATICPSDQTPHEGRKFPTDQGASSIGSFHQEGAEFSGLYVGQFLLHTQDVVIVEHAAIKAIEFDDGQADVQ